MLTVLLDRGSLLHGLVRAWVTTTQQHVRVAHCINFPIAEKYLEGVPWVS